MPALSASADGPGRVCIAKVDAATEGIKSLSNATASALPYQFTVRIGDHPPVTTSPQKTMLVEGLEIAHPHAVLISRNGRRFASFTLRLSGHQRGSACLWFNPLYETWSLSSMTSQLRGPCTCATR